MKELLEANSTGVRSVTSVSQKLSVVGKWMGQNMLRGLVNGAKPGKEEGKSWSY